MNDAHWNPVLQRLLSVANGQLRSSLSEVTFQRGQSWMSDAALQPQLWFPEQGVLALQQQVRDTPVEVALLGCDSGVPVSGQDGMGLRALTDGRAHVLPSALVYSLCPELALQCQQALLQHMGRWAYCARHHGLPQALADRLLWAHRTRPQEALSWSVHDLPGRQGVLPAQMDRAVQDLVRAGALALQGASLSLQAPDVLISRACGCLSQVSHAPQTAVGQARVLTRTAGGH